MTSRSVSLAADLAQIFLQRVDPYVTDGHFQISTIALPLAFFAFMFVVWRVCAFRAERPPLLTDGGGGGSGRDINDPAATATSASSPSVLPLFGK